MTPRTTTRPPPRPGPTSSSVRRRPLAPEVEDTAPLQALASGDMERLTSLLRDAWLPAVLTVVAVGEAAEAGARQPGGVAALLSVLLPMAWVTVRRRREPALVAAAVTVLTVVLVLAVQTDLSQQPPLTGFLALLTSLFALGVHGTGRWFVATIVAIAATLVGLQTAFLLAGQPLGDVVPSTLFLGGAFGIGRLVHHARTEARAERSRAELAEQERERHGAEAAQAERSRIARELHDVVAHALSVMVIQASVEARLHSDQGGTTVDTLRSIERVGREAMVELRRLLGILREDGQGPAAAPLPSLASVGGLLTDLRRAGHDVRLEHAGELEDLPPGVGLAAYRILQECLTNAARHAPGANVRVSLGRDDDAVRLTVDNEPGRRRGTGISSGGFGLSGIRERVRLYGGEVRAEPRPDGGFTVDAHIPLAADAGRAG